MADRMMQRRDASLRRIAMTLPLPRRGSEESFRSYYRRVAEAWLRTEGDRLPEEAERVRRLLDRDERRALQGPAAPGRQDLGAPRGATRPPRVPSPRASGAGEFGSKM
jgi:hypothetical protein